VLDQDVKALAEALITVGISIESLALPNHNFGDNGARNVVRLLRVREESATPPPAA
jgi:hypothetical protein